MKIKDKLYFYKGTKSTKFGRGVGACNTVIIGDVNPIIIDPGVSVRRNFRSLRKRMHKDGLKISEISKMMFTHVHFDHSNAASFVQELSNCSIYTHPLDIESITNPDSEYERVILPIMDAEIYPKIPLSWAKFFTSLTIGKRRPVFNVFPLHNHEKITHEGITIEVFFTPGHSPGHLGFYIPKYKAFIGGDIIDGEMYGILNSGGCINNMEFSWQDYYSTLDLLASLDIEIYIPGHGAPVLGKENVSFFIDDNTRISLDKPCQVLNQIPKAGSDLKAILKKIYPRLSFAQFLIRKIEIYLILKYLEYSEKIKCVKKRNKLRCIPI